MIVHQGCEDLVQWKLVIRSCVYGAAVGSQQSDGRRREGRTGGWVAFDLCPEKVVRGYHPGENFKFYIQNGALSCIRRQAIECY